MNEREKDLKDRLMRIEEKLNTLLENLSQEGGSNTDIKLLTVESVAEMLNVAIGTVYNWVHQEIIPYIKVGRMLLFDEMEIKEFLKKKRKEQNRVSQ